MRARAWDQLPGVCRAVVALAERVYGSRATDKPLRNEVYLHARISPTRWVRRTHQRDRTQLVNLGYANTADVFVSADIDQAAWTVFAHLAFFPFSATLPYFRRVPIEFHSRT